MPIRLTAENALDTLRTTGKKYIIGLDECGTGSLAGPLYVVAFMAPIDWNMDGLNDSKKLSSKKRELIYEELFNEAQNEPISFATSTKSANMIDEMGLHPALKAAYVAVLNYVQFEWNDTEKSEVAIVLDGILTIPGVEHYILPKADAIIPHVMAASILGKVARDCVMNGLHNEHPHYGWSKNKGYSTTGHLKALEQYGPCTHHRVSYAPVKKVIERMTKQ